MGAPLSSLLANIFVENLENWALDSHFLNHVFWGRFMDDLISVWNYISVDKKMSESVLRINGGHHSSNKKHLFENSNVLK